MCDRRFSTNHTYIKKYDCKLFSYPAMTKTTGYTHIFVKEIKKTFRGNV